MLVNVRLRRCPIGDGKRVKVPYSIDRLCLWSVAPRRHRGRQSIPPGICWQCPNRMRASSKRPPWRCATASPNAGKVFCNSSDRAPSSTSRHSTTCRPVSRPRSAIGPSGRTTKRSGRSRGRLPNGSYPLNLARKRPVRFSAQNRTMPARPAGLRRTLLRGLQEARLIYWLQLQPGEKRVSRQQPSIAAFPIRIEEPVR